ncbi:MAG: AsmA family protein [Devosia sp.]|uniref:AsmA family protein n=1 Tax=Devosia sp. TaxID=1871048 RepID=UPI001A3C9E65|nr:AsmA family protein [Devosia sp.]MBL8597689.1 AsmA family protein [Devosia sp.]
MLNRLFVIVGFLVILAIGGAFVIPRFITWSDYRPRLEAMATQAFGTPVEITGDISLNLLPQPLLVFTKVRVGPAEAPAIEVEKVEAEFSLFDFLSDRYKVTRLELEQPVVTVAIREDGSVDSGFALAPEAAQSNVSIANAAIVGGRVQLADARSGETHVAEAITGELRLDSIKGPFSFQGSGTLDSAAYTMRVSTAQLDDAGATTLSLYLQAEDRSFTVEASGALQTGAAPKFAGDFTYRRPPPRPVEGQIVDAGRGDLLLQGKVEAVADRVLLSEYTLLPDENRAATRLLGAAELQLGKGMVFNAIVSGSVIALPPRDATKELTDPPYELVRLLGETPLPPIPNIPGTIGLDITELNLRGVSLRDLRLDAATDAKSWTIEHFSASLPGSTKVGLTGNLSVVDGHPIFAGGVTVASQQLDRLAALWRKAPDGNPLFNMEGSLTSDVALSSDTLTLSSGTLVLAGINQGFDAAINFGAQRELKLGVHFTTLGQEESNAIAALLPDVVGTGSFGATFPKGAIDVSASRAVLFGLPGSGLAALANWEGGVLELSKLHADDLGGAMIDAKLTAFGTLMKPELSGNGSIRISDGAPIVTAVLGSIHTPPAIAEFLHRSLPATLDVQLDPPTGEGEQTLNATGRLGTADTKIVAQLGGGIANALVAPLAATLELNSESPALMTAQLGLGSTPILDDRTPLHLATTIEGTPANSYEIHARLEGGADRIAFDGNVVPGDFTRIGGNGSVEMVLSDPGILAEIAGAEGIYVPALSGRAQLRFDGLDSITLADIETADATGVLALTRRDGIAAITGSLKLASLDAIALLPMLAGPSGTVAGEGLWPEGPIDIGDGPRASTGRIDVAVAEVTAGGQKLLADATFGLDWDAQSIGLRELSGEAEGGTLTLDAKVCCSNPALPAKQLTGRLALDGVPLDVVAPGAIAAGLDGKLTATAAFDGTGETMAAAVRAMTGTGSYTISDFSAQNFDPQAFNSLGALTGIIDMTPEALTAAVNEELAKGPFASNMFTGSFTVAGGTLRSPNLAIAGSGARIFGSGNLQLADLTLDARYAMSPTVIADPASMIDPTTAEVTAVVTGPLWAPVASYDVASLVDGMKIKASEIELARLEQLRLEDEARQRELAAERARVAAEQAAAAEARRKAEQEAAEKAAAEAESRRLAEEAARAAAQPPATPAPIDLGL